MSCGVKLRVAKWLILREINCTIFNFADRCRGAVPELSTRYIYNIYRYTIWLTGTSMNGKNYEVGLDTACAGTTSYVVRGPAHNICKILFSITKYFSETGEGSGAPVHAERFLREGTVHQLQHRRHGQQGWPDGALRPRQGQHRRHHRLHQQPARIRYFDKFNVFG